MNELKKDAPEYVQEYKTEVRHAHRDPFKYVRQRNNFWAEAGDVFTSLLSGYVVFNLVKGILMIAFLIAILKLCCGGN